MSAGAEAASRDVRVLPGWVSLLPAFTAIAVALIIRSVVPALLLGLWIGATALHSFSLKGAGVGLLDTFQVFVTNAVANSYVEYHTELYKLPDPSGMMLARADSTMVALERAETERSLLLEEIGQLPDGSD